ncbi:MAG: DNA alkylation repair protein [Methanomassiliicoccaceae archaeon]|nr:DNA alkylation repair protein [Methanomassiliicoccaceae archaeon]
MQTDVKSELAALADPKYSEFNKKIIPGAENILGVRMPAVRNISKKICKEDWRSFLDKPAFFYEENLLRGMVIAKAVMGFDERLDRIKGFVPEIDNWAVCDVFCGELEVNDGQDKEELWNYCLELIDTDDEYRMRVSAVMMLDHFLDDRHIDDVLRLLTTRYHPGYYYKMGAAWTLSYCFMKYPVKTEPMLFLDSLDGEIRNKAVQKISDSFRVSKEDKERLKAKKKGL